MLVPTLISVAAALSGLAVVLLTRAPGSSLTSATTPATSASTPATSASTPAVSHSTTHAVTHHGIAPQLRAHYAVFTDVAPEAHPVATAQSEGYQGVARMLAGMGRRHDGLDLAGTRQISTANGPAWAVPGGTQACVVIAGLIHPKTTASSVCGSVANIDAHGGLGAVGGDVKTRTLWQYGLAPNRLGKGDGALVREHAHIHDNVFIIKRTNVKHLPYHDPPPPTATLRAKPRAGKTLSP